MINKYFNALCFCEYDQLFMAAKDCYKMNYISKKVRPMPKCATYYQFLDDDITPDNRFLFLPSLLLKDKTIDNIIDYALNYDSKLIVMASYDLTEAGLIDARFHLTPIQLLHKLGILDRCTIAGGSALLYEDLDLMQQENIPLIVLPTYSAANGYGFAPIVAAVKRGVKIMLGTGDNYWNPNADMYQESQFLYLSTCADMKNKEAISFDTVLSFAKI